MSSIFHWKNKLPDSWECKPLKSVANYWVSNVDKLTNENEEPVQLCNYTDVYKNEYISLGIEFMNASATKEEIRKFKLEVGDIIITKDSESWDDIAIPALVKETKNDLLCGYHLALLRPDTRKLFPDFLFRCLQAKVIRLQLELASTGVTRYGLPKDEIGRLLLPIPDLKTQKAIAKHIDKETKQIDRLIESKGRLLTLLAEKKQALITRAVTKGINPNARMKDSGIDWLGEIPEHWKVKQLKFACYFYNNIRVPLSSEERSGIEKIYDYYGASGVIDKVDNFLFDGEYILIGEDGANLLSRSTALAFKAEGKFWVNNHAHILKPIVGNIDYYVFLLESVDYTVYVTGSAQPKLTVENLKSVILPIPPENEQKNIYDYIVDNTRRLDKLIATTQKTIDLLKERRAALIAAAVTGEVDVN